MLPDSKEVISAVKNAASEMKNSPMFSEVSDTIKGAVISPVKQVSANSERADILWAILILLESAMTAFGLTAFFRRGLFALFTAFGTDIGYSDYSRSIGEAGLGALKIFALQFFCTAAAIFAGIFAASLLTVICKRRTGFFVSANTMTTAFVLPSIIMAAAGIASMLFIPAAVLLISAAAASAVILSYIGIQKMSRSDTPVFWMYIICVSVVIIISTLLERLCIGSLVKNLIVRF